MKWLKYKKGKVKASGLSKFIVEALGSNLMSFFKKTQREQTTYIMDALTILGKDGLPDRREYKVMSNKISPYLQQGYTGPKQSAIFPSRYRGQFKPAEWLYDLHWYEEVASYQMTSLPLVVECEWEYKREGDEEDDDYSAVKWDFQKLLVANACLRLMIFRKRTRIFKGKEHEDLLSNDYFEDAIKGYRNFTRRSKFLFIAFDEKTRQLHYAKKIAHGQPLSCRPAKIVA